MGKLVGIVGKPSSGKSTFLNAACASDIAEVGDYPFTTINPNRGVSYVTVPCVCREMNVTCEPRNSKCIDGVRYVPVNVLDVAGLVPKAHEGRGLGNKFLDELREADVLIHVVDTSGSLNAEGENVDPGSYDPIADIEFLEEEIALWMVGILQKNWTRLTRQAETERTKIDDVLADQLTGLKIRKPQISRALNQVNLPGKPKDWGTKELYTICSEIRAQSKPIIIAANKIDRPTAEKNLSRLEKLRPNLVIPTSALAETYLQKWEEKGYLSYDRNDGVLEIHEHQISKEKEKEIIIKVQENILKKYGNTGIQQLLNKAFLEILDLKVVFPVADVSKLADNDGRVLPEAILMPQGSTPLNLAEEIHADLAKKFIHAVDARTNRRLGETYELKDRDIIRIVSAA
ncbi:MAG: redox-regulated ATPase YchF [Promethearchaeota archaeon]